MMFLTLMGRPPVAVVPKLLLIKKVDLCFPPSLHKYNNRDVQANKSTEYLPPLTSVLFPLEDQIKAIVYGDDIPCYQDLIKLYHTYYITGARIQLPYLKHERPLHTFEWILDKKTIIDPIEEDRADTLPLPVKLIVTSFGDIKREVLQTLTDVSKLEFDILAIVVNCSPPRYVPKVDKTLQELIVIDTLKQTFTFTIWEEAIMEDQGKKLLQQLSEYPIILARRIGTSIFNGVSLTTKFNTSIQIDPPYPQCQQLRRWVMENKEVFTSFTLRSTSKSGALISVSVDEEVVPIANIDTQQHGQTFSIEAKISFPHYLSSFYVLHCSKCGQEVRYLIIREVHCLNCPENHMLVPRCRFEVNLKDSSGSAVGIIMNEEAEKLLSLTTEEIYKRTLAPSEYPPIHDVQQNFRHKVFSIRAKKAFAHASSVASPKVYIQLCSEKHTDVHSLQASEAITIHEAGKRKQKVDLQQQTGQTESLKIKQKLEPPTPTKTK